MRSCFLVLVHCTFWLAGFGVATPVAAVELSSEMAGLLEQHCLDCHRGDEAEANVDLEAALQQASVADGFRLWEKVTDVVRQKKMPPEDADSPSDSERSQMIQTLERVLAHAAAENSGDPGPVVIRRLSTAELDYSVLDLTGVDLPIERILTNDAVGGEGFTNVGGVQFMDDVSLERYVEVAHLIADHAIVGAGPLAFFHTPGDSGRELFAMERIDQIYRGHGFLAGGGEQAIPYGLHRYSDAFFAVWRYRHRAELGSPHWTLDQLAGDLSVSARFVRHLDQQLNRADAPFPLNQILAAWHELSTPVAANQDFTDVRRRCEQLYELLNDWQGALAAPVEEFEESPVLTADAVHISSRQRFRASVDFALGATTGRARISLQCQDGLPGGDALVIWRSLGIRFLNAETFRPYTRPLKDYIVDADREPFGFGQTRAGVKLGEQDFVMATGQEIEFAFRIPEGMTSAEIYATTELVVSQSDDCLVRCGVTLQDASGQWGGGDADEFSFVAKPDGAAVQRIQDGVIDFATNLPQASHRAAAPSDRDPIPPVFDNRYQSKERDYFHYNVKYQRDDAFLTHGMLDDATRTKLDQAWHDLLTSFDYHDTLLRFYRQKFALESSSDEVAQWSAEQIRTAPEAARPLLDSVLASYRASQGALRAAETGHLQDVLALARRAWRRPLTDSESHVLRDYYGRLRGEGLQGEPLGHAEAIRMLIARVFASPSFLYRIEQPAESDDGVVAISQYELASRLSYLLWSSGPDEALLQAAEKGELETTEQLQRQVRRMLESPKSRRLAVEFFGQWLGFYRFDRAAKVDAKHFPEFTPEIQRDLHEEAVAYLDHILRADRPVDEILFSDYAFLNQKLAGYYGVEFGDRALSDQLELVRDVDRFQRGGALRLGAILTLTSQPLRTSPVKRGDFVLRQILGTPPPPPPPGVNALDEAEVAEGATIRERLAAHRENDACAECHAKIDPLGFALENYDRIGRWREVYASDLPIEASGTLYTGQLVDGPAGLQQYLAEHRALFHRMLAVKLLGYALGRSEMLSDRQLLGELTDRLGQEAGLGDVLTMIVNSRQFRSKRGG